MLLGTVRRKLTALVAFSAIGEINVKGRAQAVKIFKVIGLAKA